MVLNLAIAFYIISLILDAAILIALCFLISTIIKETKKKDKLLKEIANYSKQVHNQQQNIHKKHKERQAEHEQLKKCVSKKMNKHLLHIKRK